MIRSDFQPVTGPKTTGLSGSEFGFSVEALDHTDRELAFGSEPVEHKRSTTSQHAGAALHRPDLRSHRAHAPSVEEAPGPIGRAVAPEELEVLLEQVAPHAAQVVPQEIRQPHFLLLGEVLGPLQQQPPHLGQDGLAVPGPELAGFLGTDPIDGLAEVPPMM
jgi:hypothetical protein